MADPEDVFVTQQDLTPRSCPVCRGAISRVTSATTNPADPAPLPRLGEVVLCGYCASALVVTTIGYRVATAEEVARLDPMTRAIHRMLSDDPRPAPPTLTPDAELLLLILSSHGGEMSKAAATAEWTRVQQMPEAERAAWRATAVRRTQEYAALRRNVDDLTDP